MDSKRGNKKIGYQKKLAFKITLAFLISKLLALSVLFSTMYIQSYRMLTGNLAQRTLKIAQNVAANIDVEKFEKIRDLIGTNSEAYLQIQHQLS